MKLLSFKNKIKDKVQKSKKENVQKKKSFFN